MPFNFTLNVSVCFELVLVLIIFFARGTLTENHIFYYDLQSSCEDGQFYNTKTLSCQPCAPTAEQSGFQMKAQNGLSCTCRAGHRLVSATSNGGIACEQCQKDEVVSKDGLSCIRCDPSYPFDNITVSCRACPAGEISVERFLDGSLSSTKKCVACKNGTTPSEEGDRCVPCYGQYSASGSRLCGCPALTHEMAGGICFKKSDFKDIPNVPSFYFVKYEYQELESSYFCHNVRAAITMCEVYHNVTSCQLLSNLCALLLYRQGGDVQNACTRYLKLISTSAGSAPFNYHSMPWLYYISESVEETMKKKDVEATYSFKQSDKNHRLNFTAAQYSLRGEFLELGSANGSTWQLCGGSFRMLDSAFKFGTHYFKKCRIPVKELFLRPETVFFDPYLYYEIPGKLPVFYSLPVLIRNYADNRQLRGLINQWKFTRRFFLVDNVSGRTPCNEPAVLPSVIRYAKDITIRVEMYRSMNEASRIYPPLIIIDYAEATLDDFNNDKDVEVSFSVTYEMDQEKEEKDFAIAIGVLSALAIMYSAIETWSWSKRSGRLGIDFQTLIKLLLFTCGSLSTVFLTVTFLTCLYILVFFKNQTVVYVVLRTPDQEDTFIAFIIVAFGLKAIQVVHCLVCQVLVDVFFIDWERPRPRRTIPHPSESTEKGGVEDTVSIWRTYLVANEWAELQTIRKTSLGLQLFATVFFLDVIGFENLANSDPFSSLSLSEFEYRSPVSLTCRIALAVAVYSSVAFVQWIFISFIYERLIEDKIRQFVDLCSISNVSVFLMTHQHFGHYIHGRSVHGHADTDMKNMHDQLKREEDNLCSQRGLVANTDQQTFQVALPAKLRSYYDHVMAPLMEANRLPGRLSNAGPKASMLSPMDCNIQAYQTMNKFLSSFVEHALRDLDYVVRDRLFVENMLNIEFQDPIDKGFFYLDNGHSYDAALLCGHELTLIIFDLLLFICIDMAAGNFVLAAVVTFIVGKLIVILYSLASRHNLARKTLVDSRFLI